MDVIELLREHKDDIRARFRVKSIGVFGSHACGTPAQASDVDVLVEFDAPVGFYEFLDLKEFLEGLFGTGVDLATVNALKPLIRDRILKEVVYA